MIHSRGIGGKTFHGIFGADWDTGEGSGGCASYTGQPGQGPGVEESRGISGGSKSRAFESK